MTATKPTGLRQTAVVSVSLEPKTFKTLENLRKNSGQSRSSLITELIRQQAETERWQKIYRRGELTARTFRITSEENIETILNER